MHSADYAVARCLSVCLSATRRYFVLTVTHILSFFHRRYVAQSFCSFSKQQQPIYLQQKHTNITDMDINYTAAGCQGAIQLSMLAAYNFNNNDLS